MSQPLIRRRSPDQRRLSAIGLVLATLALMLASALAAGTGRPLLRVGADAGQRVQVADAGFIKAEMEAKGLSDHFHR